MYSCCLNEATTLTRQAIVSITGLLIMYIYDPFIHGLVSRSISASQSTKLTRMKRQVEIDDTLQERVDSAIDELKALLLTYLNENQPDELPELGNHLDHDGSVHEIVDSACPLYTYEIKCTWFLHQADLESAYEDAGVGENPTENDGMAAIYYLIDQRVREWYSESAQDEFNRWQQSRAQESGAQEG